MINYRSKYRHTNNIWPGFVDAISTLLLVLIFLLGLFLFSESVLSRLLSSKENILEGLNSQISQLSELLSLERKENRDLSDSIAELNRQINISNSHNETFIIENSELKNKNEELALVLENLQSKSLEQEKDNNDLKNSFEELLATFNATKVKLLSAEEELELSSAAKKQVVVLNSQIASLRNQLANIQKILDDTESKIKEKNIEIVELGKKLNTALAVKVGELNQYKSDSFLLVQYLKQ